MSTKARGREEMRHIDPLSLRSYRQHHLLIEFASLKHIQPQGVYVTLTQGEPSLWHGVLFVRRGPYAPAILRFRLSFPPEYPLVAPILAFTSDPFHPLLTPLTTASFTPSFGDSDGPSPREGLPPGGFSLRHGFPAWFRGGDDPSPGGLEGRTTSPEAAAPSRRDDTTPQTYIADVLRYTRTAFEDATVLDAVPLAAAANSSAWYAWRAHRRKAAGRASTPAKAAKTASDTPGGTPSRPRGPSEWNWEGVWEERVRKAVAGSLAEGTLYGGGAGGGGRDDEIPFAKSAPDEVGEMLGDLRGCLRVPPE